MAEGGACFVVNLIFSVPQRVFEFFSRGVFDLLGVEPPSLLRAFGDIFGCGF